MDAARRDEVPARDPVARASVSRSARGLLLACILAGPALLVATGAAAQDLKVRQLEQDLRDLQRTVAEQARRLEALERGAGTVAGRPGALGPRAGAVPAAPRASPPAADGGVPGWVSAAKWAALRDGMAELDVVATLGPPTSMRTSDDGRRRTLYYALEIGTAGWLAGSVALEARRVVDIRRPELR